MAALESDTDSEMDDDPELAFDEESDGGGTLHDVRDDEEQGEYDSEDADAEGLPGLVAAWPKLAWPWLILAHVGPT
eukprot:4069432-Prymnesium_polylepis.1